MAHWKAQQCVGQLCLSSTTLLGSAGLSGCWIPEPCGECPGSHKSLDSGWIKPQFHSDFNTDEGDLHQSHMALQVICWMTDMSLWCPASSFHISRPMESSTLFAGVSDRSKQESIQPGSRLPVGSSSTQMPCFDPRHLTATCSHLAATESYGINFLCRGL